MVRINMLWERGTRRPKYVEGGMLGCVKGSPETGSCGVPRNGFV